MISEVTLPSELTKAAESLEQRLQLLSVPTRKVLMAEWNSMPEAIHSVVPSWIPTLLSRFRLLGSVLECRHNQQNETWERYQAAPHELPADAANALRAPTNIVLYSLEPLERPSAKEQTLNGVKILGQTTRHAKQAKTAITAVETAIAQGAGFAGAHCFDPRVRRHYTRLRV